MSEVIPVRVGMSQRAHYRYGYVTGYHCGRNDHQGSLDYQRGYRHGILDSSNGDSNCVEVFVSEVSPLFVRHDVILEDQVSPTQWEALRRLARSIHFVQEVVDGAGIYGFLVG